MKTVTLKSFCFNNDQGGTVLDTEMEIEVEIIKSWEDYEIGQRYIGQVLDDEVIKKLAVLGTTGHATTKQSSDYYPKRVYFGPEEIISRGGLSKSQLNTLRLIRLLANDLDPARPKFKSTLDSIEAHVKALKKELKIETSVQQSQIKSAKGA